MTSSAAPAPLPLAVNTSILFGDRSLPARLEAVTALGIGAFETWWPFDGPAPTTADVDDFATAVQDSGLHLDGLTVFEGNRAGGDLGVANDPSAVGAFAAAVEVAAAVAEVLGCGRLTVLSGRDLADVPIEAQRAVLVDNLRVVVDAVDGLGTTVCLEPVNRVDVPGYLHATVGEVASFIDACAVEGIPLGCVYDLYHSVTSGEDPDVAIGEWAGHFHHVQVADVPGRRRPGTGTLDVAGTLRRLISAGYRGAVGLEYHPSDDGADFHWLNDLEEQGILTRSTTTHHRPDKEHP